MNLSVFYRNIIGSGLSFFIPANIMSWFCLGRFGGMSVLLFSCLLIVFLALRRGAAHFNVYIILYGISAYVGYKIYLKWVLFRNELSSRLEAMEVDKNILLSGISESKKKMEAARARVERYEALRGVTEDLSSSLDLREISRLITDHAFSVIGGSERASLFLLDPDRMGVALAASRSAETQPGSRPKGEEMFEKWILRHRKPLLIEDLDNDYRFSPDAFSDPSERRFKSVLAAPLTSEMKITGILRLDSAKKSAYTQDDLRLLSIISYLSAVSIENARLFQKTNELAVTDGLTGLYVHRFFKERLGIELEGARDQGRKMSVLMIDLDHFKECNDRYGHAAGDLLLKKVARILKTDLGAKDSISRYGGEEFAIILSGADKSAAIRTSELIRKKIEAEVLIIRREEFRITVSIGVASFPEDSGRADTLLKTADANLYKAKEGGRNMVWPRSA